MLIQPQGHSAAGRMMSMKNSTDTIEIEPATFRLVAKCLNQVRYRVHRNEFINALRSRLITHVMVQLQTNVPQTCSALKMGCVHHQVNVGSDYKLLSCSVFKVRVNITPATYKE
jgi:hypothetical protein